MGYSVQVLVKGKNFVDRDGDTGHLRKAAHTLEEYDRKLGLSDTNI